MSNRAGDQLIPPPPSPPPPPPPPGPPGEVQEADLAGGTPPAEGGGALRTLKSWNSISVVKAIVCA